MADRTREPLPSRVAQQAARLRGDLTLAGLDAVLLAAAYAAFLVARFELQIPAEYRDRFLLFLPIALAVHLAAHWMWGLYGQMWRHASVQEARRVLLAGATALLALGLVFGLGSRPVPLSVLAFGGTAGTILVGALRFHSRLFAFRRGAERKDALRVIVLGAGESGAAIVREMLRAPSHRFVPVAMLDDDPRTHGLALHGVRVLGPLRDLGATAARFRADQALLAIPSADSDVVRRAAGWADEAGVTLKVLPKMSELVGGQVSMRDVRDLSIDDLLGRKQVATDLDAVRHILRGRRVLITGAGGSIGSEIARQVATCSPAALLLLDHDETHLHEAAGSLGGACTQLLADIRERDLLVELFDRHRPDVVFHAAAHKHVPLLEDHPCEAVRTNVLGTANVIAAALSARTHRFVLISTDKAVHPSSVMGASKRLAEQLLLANAPTDAPWCAVRFGNVLGSRGSVIPTFMRQIAAGGPVTVTDPKMTRFFMSIPEAVQLVLQAGTYAGGGEIFMLDMGEAVRIVDLAERMIRLSGRRVGEDIAIRFTGVRPGEKLEEELHTPEEQQHPTGHASIVALRPVPLPPLAFAEHLGALVRAVAARDDAAAARALFSAALAPTAPAAKSSVPA